MVAEHFRPRAFPLLLATAFLFAALAPIVPVAEAQQDLVFPDIQVVRGSVKVISTSTGKPLPMMEYGDTAQISVLVINKGRGDASNFPIYFYLDDANKACYTISLAGRDNNGNPANRTVQWQFAARGPTGDRVIKILANEVPPSEWGSISCGTSAGVRAEGLGDTNNQRVADHVAWAHAIQNETIDLQISNVRWCSWADSNRCGDTSDWNVTGYPTESPLRESHFVVDVINAGNHTSLVDLSSASCRQIGSTLEPDPSTCGQFKYGVQLRLTPEGKQGETLLMQSEFDIRAELGTAEGNDEIAKYYNPKPSDTTMWVTKTPFSLVGKKGLYNVTVNVNPTGSFSESVVSNNMHGMDAFVKTTDLVAVIGGGFKTSATDAYPYSHLTEVKGEVRIDNIGSGNATLTGRPVNVTTFVDGNKFVSSNDGKTNGGVARHLLSGQSFWHNVSFAFSTFSQDTDTYLSPGKHTLTVRVDEDNLYNETNESNNVATIDFYIADNTAPKFSTDIPADSAGGATANPLLRSSNSTRPQATFGPSDTFVRPAEKFNVHARVTDDDTSDIKVSVNFTLASDPNVTRLYNMSRIQDDRYVVGITDFTFHDWVNATASDQTWNYRVDATDAFGNKASSATIPLTLRKWPVHEVPEDYLLQGQAQNRTITWSDNANPFYRIFALANMTGIVDQWNVTKNLKLIVQPPESPTVTFGPDSWGHPGSCVFAEQTGNGQPVLPGSTTPCEIYGQQQVSFLKSDPGGPGKWNATIIVSDLAGLERRINRTFYVIDELPTFRDLKVLNKTGVAVSTLKAGEVLNMSVSIRDDFDVNVSAVHLLLNRSDGTLVNLSMSKFEAETDGAAKRYWFNQTYDTGRGTNLGLAGTFDVSVAAADKHGNWNRSAVTKLTLQDSVAPTLSASVTPPEQEVAENVTFRAVSVDQTNVSVRLVVSRDGIEVLDTVLNHTSGNDYAFTTKFNKTGNYAWSMVARDGNVEPLQSEARNGVLSIRDNLGPRFEIRSPSFAVENVRYSTATPRIEVVVYDGDGVSKESIHMTVDGVEVTDFVSSAAPTGFRGFTLVHNVETKYSHNDTVTVTLNATDLSNKSLSNNATFTFRVDDAKPVSRVASFEPRFRALEGHTWNVSLDTKFSLSATDNDGLPTQVESVRFQIIGGGGATTETVYSGPFSFRDIEGAYTGPRVYLIQFFSEDDAGNRERPANQLAVYVDDTPPALDPFGSLPQGRYVNVTFVDDRSGVDRAVVWHRVNDAPYKPLSLERDGDIWRAVLPEGKKGERVSYYLQAWDRVNNTDTAGNESAPYSSYTVGNHLPQLRISNPLLGQKVNRELEIKWTATDEDNDPLVFIVYLKAPGKAEFVELATIDTSTTRSFKLDTTGYPDGQYVLAVSANDGSFVTRSETTVNFVNSVTAVGKVTAPSNAVTPDETVLLTAEIRKAQAVVEARILRNGVLVEVVVMNDDGRDGDKIANDGIYSATAKMSRSGEYTVEIVSRYQENGEAKEDTAVTSFTVKLTPGSILSEYALVWMALVVLVLAAAGVAGFALYRKWR